MKHTKHSLMKKIQGITLVTAQIAMQLISVPHAFGLQVKIDDSNPERNMNLRVREMRGGQLEETGVLKAGSIIEIPDQYVVFKEDKTVNLELSLNNWLRKAGHTDAIDAQTGSKPGRYNFDDTKKDIFFPVKVVKAASGSELGESGKTQLVALSSFARKGNLLVIAETAPVYTQPEPEAAAAPAPAPAPKAARAKVVRELAKPKVDTKPEPTAKAAPAATGKSVKVPPPKPAQLLSPNEAEKVINQKTVAAPAPLAVPAPVKDAPAQASADPIADFEAQLPCSEGVCPPDRSAPVQKLLAALGPALKNAQEKSKQIFTRTATDLDQVSSTFEKSCGLKLDEFIPHVKSRAKESGVPAEILMATLTQESSGRCFSHFKEANGAHSVGLFQINSSGSKIPRCTAEQQSTLKGLGSIARLSTGPRCLENPVHNLEEAIRVLNQKKAAVTAGLTFRGETIEGFDPKKMSENDIWRLAVSSYNGGEGWALLAKRDLERFNEKNGTKLNAHNWEDLRIFYMRRWLDRGTENKMFGSTRGGRSRDNSVKNLVYAENIIARDLDGNARLGLAQAWAVKLGTAVVAKE